MQPIEFYVPHRGPMLLLNRLLVVESEFAVAEVIVPFDGLFVRAGGVPAWVGLEYMAQTIAAWAGQRGGQAKIGFLLGSRRFQAHYAHWLSGWVLQVQVQPEAVVSPTGLGVFNCTISHQGLELACARVSTFEAS
jgi:predicted hotdog family 3-hydroxylacyl-ACP dehydratase